MPRRGTPLDDDLAARLRAAGRVVADCEERLAAAVKERDDLIRQADQAGAAMRAIAAEVGLSHTMVGKIASPPKPRAKGAAADAG